MRAPLPRSFPPPDQGPSADYGRNLHLCSETTPEGRKKTQLGQTLLNGNNIAMIVPGRGPEDEA